METEAQETIDTLDIFVPRPGSAAETVIAKGSGIVGSAAGDGRLLVDYEGNLHGASNLRDWQDRVRHAAGRHVTRYPTVARVALESDELIRIGELRVKSGKITLDESVSETGWAKRWRGEGD